KVSLIKAVILMAKELKKKIVAEGIETLEAMVILTDLGCEYGQGFYVSPAINPEDATAFLKKSLEG
ncbi:MAG: EAL domain-containing protein, partial [Anaerolineae bacterium]|nr:EAL domain-containing protein [Anaerolineae bacterium]